MANSYQSLTATEQLQLPAELNVPASKVGVLWLGNQLSEISHTRAVSEDVVSRLRSFGWSVASASGKRSRILRLADMTTTALRKRREYEVGVIDVYSGKAFLFAELLSYVLRKIKKRLLLVLHGGGLLDFQQRFPRRVKHLLAHADSVVSPSRKLIQGLSFLRPDIRYIPNGIDLSKYEFRLRSNPPPALCWLRAFHRIYNPVLAVDALALLRKDFPQAALRMIGPDKCDGSSATVRKRATELGLENSLTIVGAVAKANVPSELQKGDIFLNTTKYESFGVCLVEAAACGLPIVTTSVGEIPHIWNDRQDALLVSPEAAKMAGAAAMLLSDPTLAQKLSRNARLKAEQFDWSIIMPEWHDLISNLVVCAAPESAAPA